MVDMPFSVDGLSSFCVLLGPDVLLDDLGGSLSADLFMFCQLLIKSILTPLLKDVPRWSLAWRYS